MAVFMPSTVMAPSPRCSIRPSRLPVNLAVAFFKVMDLFDPLTDEGADILVEVRKGGGGFREDRAFYGNIVRLNTLTAKEKTGCLQSG
ncbi:MAG: hypothetical protein Ct9H300mP7_5930 [Verrucomicrobiota bacterium]|nr:MAG: hypothetical protein Ct9H300mP7_5930 [Verrucomicrobiota bacterium]